MQHQEPRHPEPSHPDILVLSENKNGNDLFIGDLHGNFALLDKVLSSLEPHDRLFVVGDLVDRGKDSLGVLRKIIEFQAKYPGKLFVIKGNHEDMSLAAIKALERLSIYAVKHNLPNLIDAILKGNGVDLKSILANHAGILNDVQSLIGYKRNGGDWLIKLFLDEMKAKQITASADGVITYSDASSVSKISYFMSHLPYIIHSAGEKPFNMVHADMPLNDEELLKKIKTHDLMLNDDEKQYATWARENKGEVHIKNTGRDQYSIPTYVGHSIIVRGEGIVVRAKTNTINIDVGAYQLDISLVVNHTKGSCYQVELTGPEVEKLSQADKQKLGSLMKELTPYLIQQMKQAEFIADIKNCNGEKDLIGLTIDKWIIESKESNARQDFTMAQLDIRKLLSFAVKKGCLSEEQKQTAEKSLPDKPAAKPPENSKKPKLLDFLFKKPDASKSKSKENPTPPPRTPNPKT